MKKFKYYVLMAVTIWSALILGACSSDDEPDRMFDDSFVSDLIDGRASAKIDIAWDGYTYEKNEAGEWVAMGYDGSRAYISPCITNNGACFANLFHDKRRFDFKAGAIWSEYKTQTNYNKDIYTPYKFDFNLKDSTIHMGTLKLNIISIEENKFLVELRGVLLYQDGRDCMDSKHCYTLTINPLKKSFTKTIETYNSVKEGKLAVARKLRSHFGNTFNWGDTFSKYYDVITGEEPWLHWKVDLKLLEEDILNDCDELYTLSRYIIQETEGNNN